MSPTGRSSLQTTKKNVYLLFPVADYFPDVTEQCTGIYTERPSCHQIHGNYVLYIHRFVQFPGNENPHKQQ